MARKGSVVVTDTVSAEFGPDGKGDVTLQNIGNQDIYLDFGGFDATFGQGLRLAMGEDVSTTDLPPAWRAQSHRLTAICDTGQSSTLTWHGG